MSILKRLMETMTPDSGLKKMAAATVLGLAACSPSPENAKNIESTRVALSTVYDTPQIAPFFKQGDSAVTYGKINGQNVDLILSSSRAGSMSGSLDLWRLHSNNGGKNYDAPVQIPGANSGLDDYSAVQLSNGKFYEVSDQDSVSGKVYECQGDMDGVANCKAIPGISTDGDTALTVSNTIDEKNLVVTSDLIGANYGIYVSPVGNWNWVQVPSCSIQGKNIYTASATGEDLLITTDAAPNYGGIAIQLFPFDGQTCTGPRKDINTTGNAFNVNAKKPGGPIMIGNMFFFRDNDGIKVAYQKTTPPDMSTPPDLTQPKDLTLPADLATPADLSQPNNPPDLAKTTDLSKPADDADAPKTDLATLDGTTPNDGGVQDQALPPDKSPSPDLSNTPDLGAADTATPADLSAPKADLAAVVDLAPAPDFTNPADLAKAANNCLPSITVNGCTITCDDIGAFHSNLGKTPCTINFNGGIDKGDSTLIFSGPEGLGFDVNPTDRKALADIGISIDMQEDPKTKGQLPRWDTGSRSGIGLGAYDTYNNLGYDAEEGDPYGITVLSSSNGLSFVTINGVKAQVVQFPGMNPADIPQGASVRLRTKDKSLVGISFVEKPDGSTKIEPPPGGCSCSTPGQGAKQTHEQIAATLGMLLGAIAIRRRGQKKE